MNPFRYAIWLMPCAEQRDALLSVIDKLAARFGTPLFAPHATLRSGVWKKSEAELIEAVEKAGRSRREHRGQFSTFAEASADEGELSLLMKTNGIDWIDQWFGFFFVRLKGGGEFFAQATKMVEGSHPPEIGHHVSLLYSFGDKHIDREALRAELAGSLPEIIRFDSLALVRPTTGRWEDVSGWETRYTVCL